MSEKKKDEDDLRDGTESMKNEKPVETKKYPFQTTRKNRPEKLELKTTENLADKQAESKNDTEILTPVVNEPMKADQNSLESVNGTRGEGGEDATLKTDPQESKELKSQLAQATETVIKNEVELDLIEVSENRETRKKIRRKDLTKKEIDEICKGRGGRGGSFTKTKTPGLDPRFQQQNQTMRCFVMYTDFYRCENILGEGEFACQWFKDVFTSICPLDWIRRWDEAREEGRFGWPKGKTQEKFPGNRYGD